jgi:transcriptional regulator with XRE-family HTH domain
MDIRVVVGDNIKIIRHIRKMTLEDLSKATGMSRTYLSGIELGKNAVTVVRLEKIAKALKIKPGILLAPKAFESIES